jgi:ADP-ribose pyrophosphatase YjhB (NUDIX family)
VEPGEHPAQAAVRETREETSLKVEAGSLVDVYFYDDDPRGSGILIVYGCHVTGGTLTDTSEAMNGTYFRPDEVPGDLAGGGHDQAIRAWQERRRKS